MAVTRDLVHLDPRGVARPGPGPRGAPRFWPYTQGWRHLRRQVHEALVDPVSAVGAAPCEAIAAALEAGGWELEPSEGGVHVLWGARLPRRMTTHAALGPAEERDHVRLWAFGRATVMAAHHEVRAEGGGHRVTSWELARERLAATLGAARMRAHPGEAEVTLVGIRDLPWDGRIWRFDSPEGVM